MDLLDDFVTNVPGRGLKDLVTQTFPGRGNVTIVQGSCVNLLATRSTESRNVEVVRNVEGDGCVVSGTEE